MAETSLESADSSAAASAEPAKQPDETASPNVTSPSTSAAATQPSPSNDEIPPTASSSTYPNAQPPPQQPSAPTTQQPQPQQQEPQVTLAALAQAGHIPTMNPPAPSNQPHPPLVPGSETNNPFAQPPPQPQAQMAASMGIGTSQPISIQGPAIGQYYSDMSGSVGPDGYELVDSSRLLSGHRSKKDVKRRTKTGCLTCRKRRIKCDERHPVCRNCEKSKRECLGYDPVFRSQPGPSSIQPAPPQSAYLDTSQAPSSGPPPLLQNHATAGAQPYSSPPLPETTTSSASPVVEQTDFAAPVSQTPEGTGQQPTVTVQETTERQESVPPMGTPLEGADKLKLHQADLDELLAVRGQLSQPLDPLATTPARIEDIKLLFMSYAVSIDRFLECRWYESQAMPHLLANGRLLAQYAALLDGFNDPQIHEPTFLARLESRETRMIWDTMCLCRFVHGQNAPPTSEIELSYAYKRLSVFEALITGSTLQQNPVTLRSLPEAEQASKLTGLGGQIKNRELQFWESIGRYLTITDDQTDCEKRRESALMVTRSLLDSFENRDIVYSMGVVRQVAKYQPRKLKPLVGATDEKDAAAKLFVACKFLEDESQGKGTSQVVKRVSGMVTQYWDQPPYNI